MTIDGVLLKDNIAAVDEIFLDIANKDIRLYRSAPNVLSMPDKFLIIRTYATYSAFASKVVGDSYDRWAMKCSGNMEWGAGNAAADVNLYRSAVDVLKTDDLFDAALGFQVAGAAGVDGSFTTVDAKTVTVTKGLITSIV